MNTRDSKWTAPISSVLGNRVGNLFARAGFPTLEDLKHAIEFYHLLTDGKHYCLRDSDAPYVRLAGQKTWTAALSALASLGFDWNEYTHYPGYHKARYVVPTLAQQRAEIKDEIHKLIEMLKTYEESLGGGSETDQ